MNKYFITVVLIFIGLFVQGQDWISWSFQYDFQIKNNKRTDYQCDSIEVSISESLSSHGTRLQSGLLDFNDSTSTYFVHLNYGCVSCGFGDLHHPPSLFIKAYIFDRFYRQNFAIIIPVTFDTLDNPSFFQRENDSTNQVIPDIPIYFNLKTIIYNNFIFVNSTNGRYDGIRVKSNGEIYMYLEDEHPFPNPQKLILLNKAASNL
ncbi:MAG: hypothetical protein R2809_11005 [Flavobacteriales bacterium]